MTTVAQIARFLAGLGSRHQNALAFSTLNAAIGWRRLAQQKRTPRIWTAHIPDHPERNARHLLELSRAIGRPNLP